MAKKVDIAKTGKTARPGKATPQAGVYPLLALRDQMDSLFDDFMSNWRMPSLSRELMDFSPFQVPTAREGGLEVKFDVADSDDAIEVTAELPGIDEKDVELTLDNGVLTIKGEKKSETETKERDYYLSERRYGSFSRAMRLPETVDQDKVKASFDKGVLSVTLPKRAEAKAKKKKIAISKA